MTDKPQEGQPQPAADLGEMEHKHVDEALKALMSSGAGRIAEERRRQIEAEGFTAEHDRKLRKGNLALAGAVYAVKAVKDLDPEKRGMVLESMMRLWPWKASDFKPTPDDPVRQLVKAGALIAAEIDKLLAAGYDRG